MKMEEGYKILFSIEDWEKQQYEIDPEIIDIKLLFFQDQKGKAKDLIVSMVENLRPCIKKDFNETNFERDLWKKISSEKRYCMDVNDPDMKKFNFSGNMDSHMTNQTLSFGVVSIATCNKFSGTKCKPQEEIDQWLYGKNLKMQVIDNKLNIYNFSNNNIIPKNLLKNRIL